VGSQSSHDRRRIALLLSVLTAFSAYGLNLTCPDFPAAVFNVIETAAPVVLTKTLMVIVLPEVTNSECTPATSSMILPFWVPWCQVPEPNALALRQGGRTRE